MSTTMRTELFRKNANVFVEDKKDVLQYNWWARGERKAINTQNVNKPIDAYRNNDRLKEQYTETVIILWYNLKQFSFTILS